MEIVWKQLWSTPLGLIPLRASSTPDSEGESTADTLSQTMLEPPWRVLIHNDTVTPYDFVIGVLVRVFQITPVFAEHITYTAHHKGIAYVTSLPKPEAERRVGKAHFAASLEGYPLLFTIEPE